MRARPIAITLALLLVLGAAAGCNADGTLRLPTGVVYPSIAPIAGSADVTASRTFPFEGASRAITVTIDGTVLAGAQHAEKSVIRFGNARENDWISDYYPAFAFEKHQDAFFSALIAQFRTIRDANGLDSDRYVELMTAYAQSLDYKIDPQDLSPKFPVETAASGSGDCDDKALILGGLLSREGYDVAILLFGPEQHVALGIRTDGPDYRDTGYAYIETTTKGFVGMPPDSVGDGIKLASAPQVFVLGKGTKKFSASAQVAQILSATDAAEKRATEVASRVTAADAGLETLKSKTNALKSRMDAALASGDTATYNALVPSYNASAASFNDAVAARNALVDEHNGIVAIDTFVIDHLDDRPGVYAYIQAHPL